MESFFAEYSNWWESIKSLWTDTNHCKECEGCGFVWIDPLLHSIGREVCQNCNSEGKIEEKLC